MTALYLGLTGLTCALVSLLSHVGEKTKCKLVFGLVLGSAGLLLGISSITLVLYNIMK